MGQFVIIGKKKADKEGNQWETRCLQHVKSLEKNTKGEPPPRV